PPDVARRGARRAGDAGADRVRGRAAPLARHAHEGDAGRRRAGHAPQPARHRGRLGAAMTETPAPPSSVMRPSTAALLKYFLYLGSLGFGGPVALVGYMQRDLVERRGWFTKEEYMKSLALAQLAPGPLAAQLAICLGYVHSRIAGATLVALAFILPSFLMTLAISWLYVRFGGLPWMQAAFYGVGAAVIGIIVLAAYKLAKLTMAKDRLQWVIFAVMAVVTAWTESEILWLFLLSGVVAMVAAAPPAWLKRSTPACLAVAATPEL